MQNLECISRPVAFLNHFWSLEKSYYFDLVPVTKNTCQIMDCAHMMTRFYKAD